MNNYGIIYNGVIYIKIRYCRINSFYKQDARSLRSLRGADIYYKYVEFEYFKVYPSLYK